MTDTRVMQPTNSTLIMTGNATDFKNYLWLLGDTGNGTCVLKQSPQLARS